MVLVKTEFILFSGIVSVKTLSNANVPIQPVYGHTSSLLGATYAACFLGALLSTLPAGMVSDRFGRVPIIRSGPAITIAGGLLLFLQPAHSLIPAARFFGGIYAGCFVVAALSIVSIPADHGKMSGYFSMALI